MPFGIVGRTGPVMRQVAGFGDRSTGRGTLGANLGRAIVTWGLYGLSVRQRRDAALFLNYFRQTCSNMVEWFWWDSSVISTTNWFPSVL